MEWNAVRELNGSVIKLHQKSVLQNELVNQSGSLHPIPTLNSATWAVLQPISQNITVMSGFTSLHQYKRNDWKILLTDVVKAKKKKEHLTLQPVRAKSVARDKCFSFLAFSYFARQSHWLQFDNILQDVIRRRWWKAMDFHVINKWMEANNTSL